MEYDYEKDIRIDHSALDVEWINQPVLLMKYARHSAQTKKDLDMAKQNLDICKAELDRDIREKPERYDIIKVTEGSIQSAILTHERYKASYQAWLNAKYEADMAQGAINAFNQRKEALENLARLFAYQYFAGPKMPRDLTWEVEERERKVNALIGPMTRKNKIV